VHVPTACLLNQTICRASLIDSLSFQGMKKAPPFSDASFR